MLYPFSLCHKSGWLVSYGTLFLSRIGFYFLPIILSSMVPLVASLMKTSDSLDGNAFKSAEHESRKLKFRQSQPEVVSSERFALLNRALALHQRQQQETLCFRSPDTITHGESTPTIIAQDTPLLGGAREPETQGATASLLSRKYSAINNLNPVSATEPIDNCKESATDTASEVALHLAAWLRCPDEPSVPEFPSPMLSFSSEEKGQPLILTYYTLQDEDPCNVSSTTHSVIDSVFQVKSVHVPYSRTQSTTPPADSASHSAQITPKFSHKCMAPSDKSVPVAETVDSKCEMCEKTKQDGTMREGHTFQKPPLPHSEDHQTCVVPAPRDTQRYHEDMAIRCPVPECCLAGTSIKLESTAGCKRHLIPLRVTLKFSAGVCLVRMRRCRRTGVPSANALQKEALVIRRNNNAYYELPKGHLECGETLHEAAKRELMEETGIQHHIVIGSRLLSERYIVKRMANQRLEKLVHYFLAYLAPEGCSDDTATDICYGDRDVDTCELRWITLAEADSAFWKSDTVQRVVRLALENNI